MFCSKTLGLPSREYNSTSTCLLHYTIYQPLIILLTNHLQSVYYETHKKILTYGSKSKYKICKSHFNSVAQLVLDNCQCFLHTNNHYL